MPRGLVGVVFRQPHRRPTADGQENASGQCEDPRVSSESSPTRLERGHRRTFWADGNPSIERTLLRTWRTVAVTTIVESIKGESLLEETCSSKPTPFLFGKEYLLIRLHCWLCRNRNWHFAIFHMKKYCGDLSPSIESLHDVFPISSSNNDRRQSLWRALRKLLEGLLDQNSVP